MKVYFVYRTFHLNNGEHGYYMSPFFGARELAEKFLEELLSHGSDDKAWVTDDPCAPLPIIVEEDVEQHFHSVEDAYEYKYLIFSERW